MKTIATMDPEGARVLAAFLAKQGIVCQARGGTDEHGLDTTELLVPDDLEERACTAIEKWDAAMTAESERRAQRRCRECGSPHVEFVEDFDYEKSVTGITAVYRCRECGRIDVPRR